MRSPYAVSLVCSACGVEKPLVDFPARGGRLCRSCRAEKKRTYRRTSPIGASAGQRYEKTKHGYVMRQYRNMLSRVRGIQKAKAHLYLGKEIMPKHEYYKMALSCNVFNRLFAAYKAGGWKLALAPTPDRIDPFGGYVRGNIRFLTQSENSSLGALSQRQAASGKAASLLAGRSINENKRRYQEAV